MASFTAPPRPLPKFGPRKETNSEKEIKALLEKAAAEDASKDNGSEKDNDDTPITHSLRFDIPHSGGSAVPKSTHDTRPFLPAYQIEFPPDIIPWGKAISEVDTWTRFLSGLRDKGVVLGKREKAVLNYIEERRESPITIAIARQQAGEWGTTRAIWLKPRLEDNEVLDHNSIRVSRGAASVQLQMVLTPGTVWLHDRLSIHRYRRANCWSLGNVQPPSWDDGESPRIYRDRDSSTASH